MREQDFHDWMVRTREYDPLSAASHVGRAKALKNFLHMDLDSATRQNLLPSLIEKTKVRQDLTKNTRNSYASALRRYGEFAAVLS